MNYLVAAALVIAGVVHLLPLSGVLGGERLAALYGLAIEEANLAILMRHRAVLFGLIGTLLLAAVARPALRPVAFGAGIVSVASFLLLAAEVGGYNAHIARVVWIDVVVLACLLAGAAAHGYTLRRGRPRP